MRKNFFRSADTFFRAMPHFLLFELLFKLITITSGTPALTFLLQKTMKFSGIKYISDEKVWVYLKNPATVLVLFMVLFVTALFTFVELSALTVCFSCCHRRKKISVSGMFREGFRALRKALKGSGIVEFLKFMAFMPLVQFTLSSGAFTVPILPALRRAFKSVGTAPAIAVYVLLQIVLVLLIVDYSYSLHYLILTDRTFRDCTRQSRQLVRNQRKKQTVFVFVWGAAIVGVVALVTFAISFFVISCIKGFSDSGKAFLSAVRVMKYAWDVFLALSSFLIAPAILCSLTSKFFIDVPESEEIIIPDVKQSGMKKPVKYAVISAVVAVTAMLNYTYIRSLYKGNINLNVGVISRTQVTAHRGFSAEAPENTMYAFEYAVESGADYIELDVQLTADEQLVVFHDEKIDRVTDGTGKLHNFTYDELQKFSAGCKFARSDEFEDARIPLLSDVFEAVGDDILFNIEIKNKGNTSLATEKTIALIEEYGLADSCYITSFSYDVLKQVKKINPEIKTGLIANSSAVTSFTQLKYIDALSLNHLLVNAATVNSVHQSGKRIFVWTVDNTGDMQKMMALGVDNIITNRPDKALEFAYSKKISYRILMILRTLFSN